MQSTSSSSSSNYGNKIWDLNKDRKQRVWTKELCRLVYSQAPVARVQYNQYSLGSIEENFQDAYKWLFSNCIGLVSSKGDWDFALSARLVNAMGPLDRLLPLEEWICWVPAYSLLLEGYDGVGFIEQNGRYRMNFMGGKCYTYEFSYCLCNPGKQKQDDEDVEHLCCQAKCVRPSHLNLVKSSENRSKTRDICPGYIIDLQGETLYCACAHEPTCKKIAPLIKTVSF
jgi:hypothetical protein